MAVSYRFAEYYQVQALSQKYFNLLEEHRTEDLKIGGDVIIASISEEAWRGQIYRDNHIHP